MYFYPKMRSIYILKVKQNFVEIRHIYDRAVV